MGLGAVTPLFEQVAKPLPINTPQDNALKQAQITNLQAQGANNTGQAQEQQLKNQQIQQQLQEYNTIRNYVSQNGNDIQKAFAPGSPLQGQINPETWASFNKTLADTANTAATAAKSHADTVKMEQQGVQDYSNQMATWANSLLQGNAPPAAILSSLDLQDQQHPQHKDTTANIRQAIQADPTQAPAILARFLSLASPDVAEKLQKLNQDAAAAPLANAKTAADTGLIQAQTATANDAQATAKLQRNATYLASAAKAGPFQLSNALSGLSPEESAPFANAKTPQDFLDIGTTPTAQVTAGQKGQEIAETGRHNKESEKTSAAEAAAKTLEASIASRKFTAENGGDAVKGWAQTLKDNPDAAASVPPALRTAVQQQFTKDTGLPFPKPLTGTALDQERAAKNTLEAVRQISEDSQDPEIQSRIGAVLGRLGETEQSVGTAVGLSPEAEQKAQRLRSNMRYMVMTDAKALLGGRMPQKLVEQLTSSSPRTDMDMPTLQGSMSAVQDALMRTLDSADQQRFGGKMRSPQDRGIAPVQIKGAARNVGDVVTIKGKPMKITKVYSDGTFDAK